MKDELLTLIKTRRSCRKYTAQQVSDEALHSITEAGLYAPSGHGKQDPVIVVVQDEAMKAQLVAMNAAVMGVSSNPYYNAPTIILVFASADNPNAFQDGSCVLENMMLAAHAEGAGLVLDKPRAPNVSYRRGQGTDAEDGSARRYDRHRSLVGGLCRWPLARGR